MKSFTACAFAVCALLLVSFASAAPLDDSKNAQVLRFDNDNVGVDGYKFAVETSDGLYRDETGVLENSGTDAEAFVVKGSYKWIADDGKKYIVNYVADENGFQPQGEHLPKV